MDFGLSQDQEMLCDAISRTLADTCPLDHVRECAEGSVPFSDNVRSALGEIGIWGMMVPEQHDGLGMTMLDAAAVAEQLGYAVAPVPFIGAHVLAPLALAQGGSEELKAHWLPRIAKGEAQIAVAIAETVEIRDRAGVDFDGAKLDGTALFALDFLEADAFQKYEPFHYQPETGASDEELRQYILENSATIFHPVGTCKMGVDETAVVTPDLKVRGVEGLRVCDASIMPSITGGNTNAPAIMIGERGADLVLGRG